MTSTDHCFDDLISSFKITCSALERKAEFNLKQIENEWGEEFSSSIKSLRKFDEVVADISKACADVVDNDEILKSSTVIDKTENVISLPYDRHADVVKCMNELFNNFSPLGKGAQKDKLIDEKNELSAGELLKTFSKNIHDVKDIESTIIEAKEII